MALSAALRPRECVISIAADHHETGEIVASPSADCDPERRCGQEPGRSQLIANAAGFCWPRFPPDYRPHEQEIPKRSECGISSAAARLQEVPLDDTR